MGRRCLQYDVGGLHRVAVWQLGCLGSSFEEVLAQMLWNADVLCVCARRWR